MLWVKQKNLMDSKEENATKLALGELIVTSGSTNEEL